MTLLSELSKESLRGAAEIEAVEQFICRLYGIKETDCVNEARKIKLFALADYEENEDPPKTLKNKVKKVNCSLLPPCQKVLKNKIKRCQYVSQVWAKADTHYPSEGLCPSKFGWEKDGEKWVPTWYPGLPLPGKLVKEPAEGSKDEEEDEDGTWSEDSDDDEED